MLTDRGSHLALERVEDLERPTTVGIGAKALVNLRNGAWIPAQAEGGISASW